MAKLVFTRAELALLDAIHTDPNDDAPRLVYAGWLEEHGHPDRATFLRLQCEAARLPAEGRERRAKARTAEALLRAHKHEWFGPLWKAFHSRKSKGSQLLIDRGFVVELRGDAKTIMKHATDIDHFAPVLRRLEVHRTGPLAGPLLDLSLLRRLPELCLHGLDASGMQALADHPLSDSLECLELEFELHDEQETLDGLADTAAVQSAQRLDLHFGYHLHNDEVPEVGLAAAVRPTIRELTRLKVSRLRGLGFWGLTVESAAALAAWPGLPALDWIDFHTAFATDDGVVTLLSAPRLPRLRRLSLNENSLTNKSARSIAGCDGLSALSSLALDWNDLTDAGAKALAESTALPATLQLDVSFNHLTDRGVDRLRERFGRGVVSEQQL